MTNPTILEVTREKEAIWLEQPGDYIVNLSQEGASVEIKGGWNVAGTDKAIVNLHIVHQAPHTRSTTLLRGVARDQAQITLNGTIVVETTAANTNAFLTENILLLSPTAVAHAIPNLEISTDAVKCSHAATISPIPEQQLFYLQTRGMSREQAQDIIISGFLSAVTQIEE
jgi:Fe-S cluster assembly protein SufD